MWPSVNASDTGAYRLKTVSACSFSSVVPVKMRRSLIPALKVSTSGGCGGGVTCQGSVFGNCCSQYNYW